MDVFSYGVLLLEMASREIAKGAQRREEILGEMDWPAMEGLVRECTKEEQGVRPTMGLILKRIASMIQSCGGKNVVKHPHGQGTPKL